MQVSRLRRAAIAELAALGAAKDIGACLQQHLARSLRIRLMKADDAAALAFGHGQDFGYRIWNKAIVPSPAAARHLFHV